MEDWRWILWLVGILAVARLAPVLMLLPAYMRMRLRPPRARAVAPESLAPEVVAWLRETAEPLRALGFEEAGFARLSETLDTADEEEVHLLLRHTETGTYADLMPCQLPDHRLPWRIDFESHLADGRTLITLNALGHTIIGEAPGVLVNDAACPTERELWEAHRAALAGLGQTASLDFPEKLRRAEAAGVELLRDLERRERIRRETGAERYRLRPRAVLRLAWQTGMGNSRRERFLNQRAAAIAAGDLPDREVPIWQEVSAYLRSRRATREPLRRAQVAALFAGSGLAFGLAMAAVFGAVGVLCLAGVVALHELGHYVAMRVFGYRDTSVFFIPFLGAATAGRKDDATLVQEMIVLLAGPLPGIGLGAALAFAAPGFVEAGAGRELVLMLVLINLFNLVPVMPLDGGKVLDRLLLAQRPWLGLGVGALGVAGLGALALKANDWVLLAFLALFALAIRSRFHTARLVERLPALDLRSAGEEERARAAFGLLAREPRQPFARKVALARTLESHWSRDPASRAARLAWLAGYAACVVAGIVAAGSALVTIQQGV